MLIREYTAADREACIKLFQGNMPRYFDPIELPGFKSWLDARDQGLIAYPMNQAEYYYVVERNKQIAACGGFYIFKDEPSANMAWGMVDNSLHRQGIGKELLEFRISRILEVSPDAAISLCTSQYSYPFFEKLGFQLTKVTKDYFAKGLDRYDMVRN